MFLTPPIQDLGGTGPPLLLTPANGFPREPERFLGLVLLDVTVMTRARMAEVATLSPQGLEGRTPLISGALNRRQQFDSLEEAFDYWRDKPLFADWSDEALRCYTGRSRAHAGDGRAEADPDVEVLISLTLPPRSGELRDHMLEGWS